MLLDPLPLPGGAATANVSNLVPSAVYEASIERRGQTSIHFPKRQLLMHTELHGVVLLGLPATHKWVLHGPWVDRTHVRNAFTYALVRTAFGRYAPLTTFAELFLDQAAEPVLNMETNYMGVYTIVQKISTASASLDISKSHGMVLKFGVAGDDDVAVDVINDAGVNVSCVIEHPDVEDLTAARFDDIAETVRAVSRELAACNTSLPCNYAPLIDVASFVDFVIVQELSKNIDAYRKSFFLHKDTHDKLTAGPVWDFNIAWGKSNFLDGDTVDGFVFANPDMLAEDPSPPFWISALLADPAFACALRFRYVLLRQGPLGDAPLVALFNATLAAIPPSAFARNFERWPLLGHWIWPDPYGRSPESVAQAADWTIDFILARAAWLDAALPALGPAVCPPRPPPTATLASDAPAALVTGGHVQVQFSTGMDTAAVEASLRIMRDGDTESGSGLAWRASWRDSVTATSGTLHIGGLDEHSEASTWATVKALVLVSVLVVCGLLAWRRWYAAPFALITDISVDLERRGMLDASGTGVIVGERGFDEGRGSSDDGDDGIRLLPL
ncbi:cellulose-binding family II [Thecamonas trahens ATCC 50062]|uniref:Cellulose-binding family II n=1 Tax=Thecamonas trahens ATCC 50062 TaxID=461836 RepID=A0A0L0DJD1_THETB|nr:cellulose-binding family II [Thecamonas trahens ATCC 50062]KNC52514.1 cellulose-binding family II [Thecamonas trahens ATCC 50062]|eukprot:XP_013755308.1 cellulose-binding family II [Thecamonas trahens ATCC 50062]